MSRPKSAKTVSTTSTPSEPKQRGRKPVSLCCDQPGTGMGYVVKEIATKNLIRVSTVAARDLTRPGSKIKTLRQFTNIAEPFFTIKIGSHLAGMTTTDILCGGHHKKALSRCGKYEWLSKSLSDARKEGLEMIEPGYVSKEEKPVVAKVKKAKSVKADKPKSVKKVRKAKAVIAAPTSTPADAPNILFASNDEDVSNTAEAIVNSAVETPVVKTEQTMADFEKEVDAEFEADLNKIQAKQS